MNDYKKMLEGKLYISRIDPKINELRKNRYIFLDEFNSTKYSEDDKREELARKYFGKVGKSFHLEKPFHCDYASNIFIGDNFYGNFGLIFLDVNKIIIGDNVFIAPNTCLFTAGHPIDKDVRNKNLEFGLPIIIGNDVWIGGNVTINPGVKIGNNVVIGSGSVVVKDIEDNVVACGNPCKVIRKITLEDKKYWLKQEENYYLD